MLNIQSYEILDFNSDNLVVSKKGVSKISSPPLLAALNKLQSYKNISRSELNEVLSTHGLNPEPAFDFLEKIISIKDACEDLYFDKTIVAHDWDENINLEELLRSEINTPLEVCSISGLVRDQTLNKKYYIVIMCRNYDYELIKKYTSSLQMWHLKVRSVFVTLWVMLIVSVSHIVRRLGIHVIFAI